MSDQSRTKIIGLIVIVLLTTLGTAGAVAYNNRSTAADSVSTTTTSSPDTSTSSTSTATTATATTESTGSSSTATSTASSYKDGTYSANGSFYNPDGSEQIGVTVTLASDKITNVSIDSSSIYSRTSADYTNLFASGINKAVDGLNIKDVKVNRISGASLTPMGFNAALETIKNNAKAS